MTLIERWENLNESEIIYEMQMLFKNFSNAVYLFTTDENSRRIRYCTDHSKNTEIETYGKKPGICLSEKTALENIKQILLDYTFCSYLSSAMICRRLISAFSYGILSELSVTKRVKNTSSDMRFSCLKNAGIMQVSAFQK